MMRFMVLWIKAPAAIPDDLKSQELTVALQHVSDELAYTLLCSILDCLSFLVFPKTSLLKCFPFTCRRFTDMRKHCDAYSE